MNKIKCIEDEYQRNISENESNFIKELKRNKDSWNVSEKQRREQWIKDKTKEIKEQTIRGLEPEVQRIIRKSKNDLTLKEEEYEQKLNKMRIQIQSEVELRLEDQKEYLRKKHNEELHNERKEYEIRSREAYLE